LTVEITCVSFQLNNLFLVHSTPVQPESKRPMLSFPQHQSEYTLSYNDINQFVTARDTDLIPNYFTLPIPREKPAPLHAIVKQERIQIQSPYPNNAFIDPINTSPQSLTVGQHHHALYPPLSSPGSDVICEDGTSEANRNSSLPLSAQPLLQRVMGKSKKPYLYAVCMTVELELGVHRENDVFLVFNDNLFMTAVGVFNQYKNKRPRDSYGAYKSIKRWANVLDKRRKGNSWRFSFKTDKERVWKSAFAEIEAVLKIQSTVTWFCPKRNANVSFDITSKEFASIIAEKSRQP